MLNANSKNIKLFINNALIGTFTMTSIFAIVNGMKNVKSMSFATDKICFVDNYM